MTNERPPCGPTVEESYPGELSGLIDSFVEVAKKSRKDATAAAIEYLRKRRIAEDAAAIATGVEMHVDHEERATLPECHIADHSVQARDDAEDAKAARLTALALDLEKLKDRRADLDALWGEDSERRMMSALRVIDVQSDIIERLCEIVGTLP